MATKLDLPQIEVVPIALVIKNPNNPRIIKDEKFKKLVRSVTDFPEMLNLRPVIVNSEMMALGGNMRLAAAISAGHTSIPIIRAEHLTEAQQAEFIIKDNVGFGEWDWELLANNWDEQLILDWGLDYDFGNQETEEEMYSKKIEAPSYETSNEKPPVIDLFDDAKTRQLIEEINGSDISDSDKQFLIKAAYRHCVFDYAKIADYYANSDKDVQSLMEKSALIIIDFNKAIENGYIQLTKGIADLFTEDYGNDQ